MTNELYLLYTEGGFKFGACLISSLKKAATIAVFHRRRTICVVPNMAMVQLKARRMYVLFFAVTL
jgi:hypothetical protein